MEIKTRIVVHNRDINIFYDQYVDRIPHDQESFLGHFDVLLWDDLKNNLNACEHLQRKPFYKIALLRGEACYHSNGKDLQISGRNIVFTDPLTRSSFRTDDPAFTGIYCVFSESFIKGTSRISMKDWPVFRTKGIFSLALQEEQYRDLLQIFDKIREEYNFQYAYKEPLIRNRIFDLIHYTQKLMAIEVVEQAEEYIEERFFKMLENTFFQISPDHPLAEKSPSYFAGLLHMTTDRLNKALKRATGKTTQTHIHERVIEEANVLLRHTTYSIKEIAWILHFQETSHFLNFYKKYRHCTPLEYRNA